MSHHVTCHGIAMSHHVTCHGIAMSHASPSSLKEKEKEKGIQKKRNIKSRKIDKQKQKRKC